MICPNCGSEQPESFECVKCGIIFAKYEEHQARIRDGLVPEEDIGWSRNIGPTARIGRIVAGVAALVLAVIMFLNGTAARAFGPFIAFVFFAGAGLYFLISLREKMPVWRFAVEAAAVASVSVVLFMSLPDVFSLGRPMYKSTVAVRPPSEVRIMLSSSRDRVLAIRQFMNAKALPNTEEAVALSKGLDVDRLDDLFQTIPTVDRDIMHPVYARLAALRPLLGTLQKRFPTELPKGPASWVPAAIADAVFTQLEMVEADIQVLERTLAAREEAIRTGALSNIPPD
ncbi:MAG: hypothetical protein ISR64_01780 [Deltaproteobacteria bacterium]|nr:hypothetical protein [Deltaproteobacteria bacterium]